MIDIEARKKYQDSVWANLQKTLEKMKSICEEQDFMLLEWTTENTDNKNRDVVIKLHFSERLWKGQNDSSSNQK